MESLREIYRIGHGPSASHTMGPRFAAERFRARFPDAKRYGVTLFGSLAATGRGHLTDRAIEDVFADRECVIEWRPEEQLPMHPNGMCWYLINDEGNRADNWVIYSVGGGALREPGGAGSPPQVYALSSMAQIMDWCEQNQKTLAGYAFACEGDDLRDYLKRVWAVMQETLATGLQAEGVLPGMLGVKRKAKGYFERSQKMSPDTRRTGLLSAFALAVSETNASGGRVATAPTCGACGIVPAVLQYMHTTQGFDEPAIIDAMATAGIVGNLVKTNASISGAEVGCQGEVGTACAMGAAAAAQLLGGSVKQIEYAAEMGIEHHLGLTCDPVLGMVQIPCIERNSVASIRAVDCAQLACISDGDHQISFDAVVETMKRTGADMHQNYRETSAAGLALVTLTAQPSTRTDAKP